MEFPQTTSGLTQARCSSLQTRSEQKKRLESSKVDWLMDLQESRGTWYTEKMARYYSPASAPRKAQDLIERLAGLFSEYQVTDAEFVAIKRRVRETEFSGTSYAPLPNESQLLEIIVDVQRGHAVDHQSQPELIRPATETTEDIYGVMICGDGEKIVRDRYFFRNMMQASELFGGYQYPDHWRDEAFALMDERHRASYGRAPDDAGRMLVLRHYYDGLDLPARRSKPGVEIERLRHLGIEKREPWSRYETINNEKQETR